MKYNSTLTFIVRKEESDGMGGSIVTDGNGQSFQAFMQPVKAENVLKEYGLVTNKPFRVVTKTKLEPLESYLLSDGSFRYKIIENLNLKYNVMLVEVIS